MADPVRALWPIRVAFRTDGGRGQDYLQDEKSQ